MAKKRTASLKIAYPQLMIILSIFQKILVPELAVVNKSMAMDSSPYEDAPAKVMSLATGLGCQRG